MWISMGQISGPRFKTCVNQHMYSFHMIRREYITVDYRSCSTWQWVIGISTDKQFSVYYFHYSKHDDIVDSIFLFFFFFTATTVDQFLASYNMPVSETGKSNQRIKQVCHVKMSLSVGTVLFSPRTYVCGKKWWKKNGLSVKSENL